MNDQQRASYLKEAEYKEQLAKDLLRADAWQADQMAEAAKRMRDEASPNNSADLLPV